MNGLKKWMVVLMTGVTLMGNVIGMGTTVIASKNETQESLSGVDVYMPENGSLERVIRVYEDGSFVTEPINDIRTYATNTPCEHPARYLEARGKKTDFQTVGTAGICYKERLIISNKCNSIPELAATETVPISILAITLIHIFFRFILIFPQITIFSCIHIFYRSFLMQDKNACYNKTIHFSFFCI